jgi:hypothetical protein
MRSAFRTLENRCEISSTVRPARRPLTRSNKSCSALGSRAAVVLGRNPPEFANSQPSQGQSGEVPAREPCCLQPPECRRW